jgi:hypothetical protein
MLSSEEFDEEYELERQIRHKQLKDSVKVIKQEDTELLERPSND